MNRERERFRGGSLATRLRREAAADRPVFSAELHDRLMKRLRPQPLRPATLGMPVRPAGSGSGTPLPLLAAALVAGLAVVMVTAAAWRRDRGAGQGDGLAAVVAGPVTAPTAADLIGSDGPVGLERLPMFDEIDAGVRDGVASLAASLFEAPDWALLAGLDARAVLDPGDWSPVTP